MEGSQRRGDLVWVMPEIVDDRDAVAPHPTSSNRRFSPVKPGDRRDRLGERNAGRAAAAMRRQRIGDIVSPGHREADGMRVALRHQVEADCERFGRAGCAR